MAGKDRTGPLGAGPMTGRGLGYCNPNINRTEVGLGASRGACLGLGRGRGCGAGMGRRGRGLGFYQADPKTQTELLIEEKEILENRLNLINESLEE